MPDQQGQHAGGSVQQAKQQSAAIGQWASFGLGAGIAAVAATVVVSAFGLVTGRKQLATNMVKARMIITATTMGFYAGSSGWLPPPPLLNTIMGREPRKLPDASQL